jgi:TetR/AcrR family fatty acid metabolism transcriptional regulator
VSRNQKKEAIIKAAQEIFSEKGVRDTTITEIAKRAGIVDSNIYHYFKNKEDLLFWALDEQLKWSSDELAFQFKGILGPVSKLGKMIWFHLHLNDFDKGNARIRKNLLLECRSRKEFYKHECSKTLQKHTRMLVDILRQGIEENYFHNDINIFLVRDIIFGFLDEESLTCLSAEEISETLPDFDAIMDLILTMIEVQSENETQSMEKIGRAAMVQEAAKAVFAEKGFDKSTTLEIANRAGVAEGTIYEYSKNKQDLLFSIPREKFQSYRHQMEEAYRSTDPLIQLRQMMWSHFCIFLSDRRFLLVYLNDVKLNKQFYTSGSYPQLLQYLDILYEILDRGKQKGVFKQTLNNRIYRNLFVGAFTHMAIRWFIHGNLSPLAVMEEFTQSCDLLCRAILVKPGQSDTL